MEPIPVQRRSASQPATSPAPALASSATGRHGGPATAPETIGQVRSFAEMFAAADPGRAMVQTDDHPGYTTVQLQTAAEPPTSPPSEQPTAAAAAEPPAATAAPPPAAAPAAVAAGASAAPAGPSAADLDEMARRLYEPLSARLRAELWLDRERAGLVTDARY
jgi:hypothetical protein